MNRCLLRLLRRLFHHHFHKKKSHKVNYLDQELYKDIHFPKDPTVIPYQYMVLSTVKELDIKSVFPIKPLSPELLMESFRRLYNNAPVLV